MHSPPRLQTPAFSAAALLRSLGVRLQLHREAGKIALIYAAVASCWIAFSDELLGALVRDPASLVRLSILKGFAFVAVTAGVLFLLLRRTFHAIESALSRVARTESERQLAQTRLEEKTRLLEEANRQLQRDIAARESAESALRESEERFRQLAESIDDVFWLRGLDGQLFYVSPAYARVFGKSCASLYEHPEGWFEQVHVEDRARVRSWTMRDPADKPAETYRIVRPDGSVCWLRARLYPVRDAAGHVYRVAGVSRDITEFQLLEEQFRQAQKMEAIGRLAGGVAHDFNNILSVVLSYTSLVLEQLTVNDPRRADIEEVRRAGERATELTRQLLAFSRHQPRQPRVLDLQHTLHEMQNMLHRLLGADVSLSLIAAANGSHIYADRGQIEQIVMNLVVNARDAMPLGGKLTLEVADAELPRDLLIPQSELRPGPYVVLRVTDTGTGIDAATRERIFEPFFTTKELGKGTGLGLSTVFGIVKQSEGHIALESEPGKGTTFRIYFPACQRAIDQAPPSPLPPASLRGSETILLVEDDAQVREMNRSILQRNGYDVIDAGNGEEAIRASERVARRIHLLLTDVVMPQLSGCELAERLAPSRPGMRVLYVSGYAPDAIMQYLIDPRLSLLQKPITPDALLRKVRAVLDSSELASR